MIPLIQEFAYALKQEGMMVPTNSLHTAISSLDFIDLLDRDQFYAALQGSLVIDQNDQGTFDRVFTSVFIEQNPVKLTDESQIFKINLKEFTDQMRREGDPVTHILADYIEGNTQGLMDKLGIEAIEPDHVPAQVTDELKEYSKTPSKRDEERLRNRVRVLIELAEDFSARSFNMNREKREKLSEYIRERLEEAAMLLDSTKSKSRNRRQVMPWEKKRTLSTISFNQLTQREIDRVKEEVEKLAQKLHDALSAQRKKAARGHIDIKSTIRDSMRYGGVPFHIKRRTPAKKKGKVVALCDISSSVSYAAQFMVLLLYRLQNRFSKIRTFVFIRHTYEISSYFERYPLEKALIKATKDHHIGMGQPSNYGSSFKSFLDSYGNALTKDTTLLILGDGQNNFNNPLTEPFEKMTEKVERTLWLNPEEEKFWYSSSNSIRHYKPFCDQVIECATLDQLAEFTKNLVL
ncbi:MAG: VWA domain-containing protein [bacterium]|nr:VWA domain-containing protein [bacterium]